MQKRTMVLSAAIGGAAALEVRTRLRHRNADWLRNDQGVGPSHFPGTHRGEDRVVRNGRDGGDTVAGRVADGGVGCHRQVGQSPSIPDSLAAAIGSCNPTGIYNWLR